MTRAPRNKGQARSIPDLGPARADALGILQLLHSAKASAAIHCVDDVCAGILEKCIWHLQKQHSLSQSDVGNDLMWAETSLPALLRLLDYAQAEVKDCLNDAPCSEHLKECIEHLIQIHEGSQEHLQKREVFTSH